MWDKNKFLEQLPTNWYMGSAVRPAIKTCLGEKETVICDLSDRRPKEDGTFEEEHYLMTDLKLIHCLILSTYFHLEIMFALSAVVSAQQEFELGKQNGRMPFPKSCLNVRLLDGNKVAIKVSNDEQGFRDAMDCLGAIFQTGPR